MFAIGTEYGIRLTFQNDTHQHKFRFLMVRRRPHGGKDYFLSLVEDPTLAERERIKVRVVPHDA